MANGHKVRRRIAEYQGCRANGTVGSTSTGWRKPRCADLNGLRRFAVTLDSLKSAINQPTDQISLGHLQATCHSSNIVELVGPEGKLATNVLPGA